MWADRLSMELYGCMEAPRSVGDPRQARLAYYVKWAVDVVIGVIFVLQC